MLLSVGMLVTLSVSLPICWYVCHLTSLSLGRTGYWGDNMEGALMVLR